MHGKSIYNVLTIEHSIGHGVFYRKKTSNVMFEVGIYFPICWFFFVQNEKINNEHNNKNKKKNIFSNNIFPFYIHLLCIINDWYIEYKAFFTFSNFVRKKYSSRFSKPLQSDCLVRTKLCWPVFYQYLREVTCEYLLLPGTHYCRLWKK